MADLDMLPERGVPALALVDSLGIATNGSQTVAQLAARGLRSVCAVDGTGVSSTGQTMAQLASRGIRAFCPVDQLGVAANGATADQLRRASIRPMVLLDANGIALNGSANLATLAQRGLQAFCPVDESGNATTMGAAVIITNTIIPDTATIGTNVGVMSVSGGTGTYTFTLLSNPGTLFATAGTNGVNLNTAATLTTGDKPITVRAAGGVPTPVDRTMNITVTGVAPSNSVLPTIDDVTPAVGDVLTAANGTWSGSATIVFSYLWRRNGVSTGVTTQTYSVTVADYTFPMSVTVTGTNSIGSSSATSANTAFVTGDSAPNSFTFTDATNQPASTVVESNTITVAGINVPATVSVTGGEYKIGTGSYTSAVGTVSVGNSVTVRGTSSPTPLGTTDVTLTIGTIGSVSDTFTITTASSGTAPTNSVAPAITGTPQDTFTLTCNPGTWAGTPTPTISYQWKRSPGEVNIGANQNTYTIVTADVGGTTFIRCDVTGQNTAGSLTVQSNDLGPVIAFDTTPDGFTFTDASDVALSTVTASNTITVLGINAAANLSISAGGEYKINAGSFASTPTTVVVNDTVQVRGTSSPSPATPVNVTLTIGGMVDTFTITTGTVPVNTGGANLPVITGSTVRGNQLTVNPGTWTGSPTPSFAYQWVRSPATPVGTGLTTYTTVVGDETKTIYCTVQGNNIVGQSNVDAAAVGPITAPAGGTIGQPIGLLLALTKAT